MLALVRNEGVVRYLNIPDEVIDYGAHEEEREFERRERAYEIIGRRRAIDATRVNE